MRCPYCKKENDKVIDSRGANDGTVIRRRRECEACARRYTTYERIEEIPLYVIKKDQRREVYDKAKVLAGIHKACEKRPVPVEEQDRIAIDLEKILHVVGEDYDREYYVRTRLKKDVTYRLLTLDTPIMREYRRLDANQNRETKFLSKEQAMDVTILVFDNTVAFFSEAKEMLALAITSESIAQAMKVIYSDLWEHAE